MQALELVLTAESPVRLDGPYTVDRASQVGLRRRPDAGQPFEWHRAFVALLHVFEAEVAVKTPLGAPAPFERSPLRDLSLDEQVGGRAGEVLDTDRREIQSVADEGVSRRLQRARQQLLVADDNAEAAVLADHRGDVVVADVVGAIHQRTQPQAARQGVDRRSIVEARRRAIQGSRRCRPRFSRHRRRLCRGPVLSGRRTVAATGQRQQQHGAAGRENSVHGSILLTGTRVPP